MLVCFPTTFLNVRPKSLTILDDLAQRTICRFVPLRSSWDRSLFVRPLSRLLRCVDGGARWRYNRAMETVYGN
jgi:hypothetical protein